MITEFMWPYTEHKLSYYILIQNSINASYKLMIFKMTLGQPVIGISLLPKIFLFPIFIQLKSRQWNAKYHIIFLPFSHEYHCQFHFLIHWRALLTQPNPTMLWGSINTSLPVQNGRHFADDMFKCIVLNENVRISIQFSLKFVRKGPIGNKSALV